jgi:hypothetical protein
VGSEAMSHRTTVRFLAVDKTCLYDIEDAVRMWLDCSSESNFAKDPQPKGLSRSILKLPLRWWPTKLMYRPNQKTNSPSRMTGSTSPLCAIPSTFIEEFPNIQSM